MDASTTPPGDLPEPGQDAPQPPGGASRAAACLAAIEAEAARRLLVLPAALPPVRPWTPPPR